MSDSCGRLTRVSPFEDRSLKPRDNDKRLKPDCLPRKSVGEDEDPHPGTSCLTLNSYCNGNCLKVWNDLPKKLTARVEDDGREYQSRGLSFWCCIVSRATRFLVLGFGCSPSLFQPSKCRRQTKRKSSGTKEYY